MDLPLSRDRARLVRTLELCDPERMLELESVFRVRLLLAGIVGWDRRVVRDRRVGSVLRTDCRFVVARLVVELGGVRCHQDRRPDRVVDGVLAAGGLGHPALRPGRRGRRHEQVLREVRDALLPPVVERAVRAG